MGVGCTSMVVYSGTRAVPSATKLRRSELWRRPYDNRMWSEVGENCGTEQKTPKPFITHRVAPLPRQLPSFLCPRFVYCTPKIVPKLTRH